MKSDFLKIVALFASMGSGTTWGQCEADATVYLTDFLFTPNEFTISVGETVAFVNAEGTHNVDGTAEGNTVDLIVGMVVGVGVGRYVGNGVGKAVGIGIGTTVSDHLVIGDNVTMDINSVVVRNVPDNSHVAGFYAKKKGSWMMKEKDELKRYM